MQSCHSRRDKLIEINIFFMGLKTLVLSTFPYFNNAGKEGKLLKQLICTENHKKNSIIALVF